MSEPDIEALQKSWNRNGFVILRQFFPAARIDAINRLVDTLWKQKDARSPITADLWIETPEQRRMLLRDAPKEAREGPHKINDLYLEFPEIRDLALDPELARVMRALFGGQPLLCNSLNFEYGSRQPAHSDNLFMPSRKPGGMLAAWIALDEVDAGNGPVEYWPGSHRIPAHRFSHGRRNAVNEEMPQWREYIEREIRERGLENEPFAARPGDVLIWHEQLIHGGVPIQDEHRSRRSVVFHYFRRRDYLHHLWRVARHNRDGFYYRRKHQPVAL